MKQMVLIFAVVVGWNVMATEVCVISEMQGVGVCTAIADCSLSADSTAKRGRNDGLCGSPRMTVIKSLLDKGYAPVGDGTLTK